MYRETSNYTNILWTIFGRACSNLATWDATQYILLINHSTLLSCLMDQHWVPQAKSMQPISPQSWTHIKLRSLTRTPSSAATAGSSRLMATTIISLIIPWSASILPPWLIPTLPWRLTEMISTSSAKSQSTSTTLSQTSCRLSTCCLIPIQITHVSLTRFKID
jgi:hypothetical protein